MRDEVILALITKLVEDRLKNLPTALRGARGAPGRPGARGEPGIDGKDFDFAEHADKIKSWVKEYSLKFSDLTEAEIAELRGPRGRDGRDGRNGENGADFSFEDSRAEITKIVSSHLESIKSDLKLRFSDLSPGEVAELRGPRGLRGQQGKPGKGFDFEEHRQFFESLKLRFSDLSEEERNSLKLKFSDLREADKGELKLRFEDLTEEDRLSIRGPRGQRGRPGPVGEQGDQGARGPIGPRGVPGPQGLTGPSGVSGRDGRDGEDAPRISDIDVDQDGNEFQLVFRFDDATEIKTPPIKSGQSVHTTAVVVAGGGEGSGGQGPKGDKGDPGEPGPKGDTGPQGPAGVSGSGLLEGLVCEPTVYVGAFVRLKKENSVDSKLSDWESLVGLESMSFQISDIVVANAIADSMENSNVIGLVESKASDEVCSVRIFGVSEGVFFSLDVFEEYYLSDTFPGAIVRSGSKPSASGAVVLKLGQALNSSQIIISRGERLQIA